MNAVCRATSFAVCLALMACGNKGDLFLNEVALSAEQRAVLEGTDPENPENPEDPEDPKKSNSDTTQPAE